MRQNYVQLFQKAKVDNDPSVKREKSRLRFSLARVEKKVWYAGKYVRCRYVHASHFQFWDVFHVQSRCDVLHCMYVQSCQNRCSEEQNKYELWNAEVPIYNKFQADSLVELNEEKTRVSLTKDSLYSLQILSNHS